MATLVDAGERRAPFFAFLTQELAPREGRSLAVARIAAATTLTVAIAMVFRIPLAAYMAYLVFLISKDDRAATTTTAVGGALAVTAAVILTVGLSLVDLGDPAIRLPAMALITFLAMLSVRTFALGPVSFLAGFIIVTMQSVIDEVPDTELFTRTALWLWVVVVVPVIITVIMTLLFGPGAATVAERSIRKVQRELEAALAHRDPLPLLAEWRAVLQPLVGKAQQPAAVQRLIDELVILEQYPERVSQATALETLRDVQQEIARPGEPGAHPAGHEARRMFVPDARSNPAYWQFALKTTIAVMIVYAVYTLLDWPGLRTSIVTCFFVALGSLGETVHKLLLRISGALIGGLAAGLCIVFLLPHLTDIGQLCVLTAVASLLAGWVATSSEQLSYSGLQIAFAFFLGLLQTDAPATDLTVLRDRAAGILLGNVVITVVFSALWPESALTRLRAALADAQRAIAAVLRAPTPSAARQQTVEALVRADHFQTLCRFELQMLPAPKLPDEHLPRLDDVQRLAGAAFLLSREPLARDADAVAVSKLADWLDAAGRATAQRSAAPRLPALPPFLGAAATQLLMEIEHVAATSR